MWTTIISLKREDATKLGYDNMSAWKTLLRSKSQDLAAAMGIPVTDMEWYAAYHNESGHPHVHLVSYSTGKEPYMTRKGLEKLKAAYAHEIFKNDLYETYEKQTEYRNELRAESKEKIAEIIRRINDKRYENETLELMLTTLAEKLQKHKGKKVYGYLPKSIKNLVNGVVEEIMKDEDLQKLYELWYEQREKVLKTYRDKMPDRLPLSANEEFKSVRNAVIAEALKISPFDIPDSVSAKRSQQVQAVNISLSVMRLFKYIFDLLADKAEDGLNMKLPRTDKKLRRKIAEKKQAQGLKLG